MRWSARIANSSRAAHALSIHRLYAGPSVEVEASAEYGLAAVNYAKCEPHVVLTSHRRKRRERSQ